MRAACPPTVVLLGWLDAFSQPNASAIALLIGLGLLALSLLVLVFTRWGQAKPLSKCLALSVFAHILLMAYAYGINLFTDDVPVAREEVVRLTVVDTEEQPKTQSAQPEPWNNFATEPPVAPEPGAPSRLDVEPAPTVDRETDRASIPLIVPELVEPTPHEEPNVPLPEAPPTAPDQTQQPRIAAAPEIESPPVEPIVEPEPPAPPDSEPERLPMTAMEAAPIHSVVTSSITDQGQTEEDLQRLVDLPEPSNAAEAAPGPMDDPQRARNSIAPIEQPTSPLRTSPAPAVQNITDGGDAQTVPVDVATQWELVSIRRSGDGREMPLSLRGRMIDDRLSLAASNGGSVRTEQAVDAALQWLASHQHATGGWDCDRYGGGQETRVLGHDRKGAGIDADMAVTGLALLAFLGAGHTHLDGDHRATVQRGLEFLLRQQGTDGNMAAGARLFAKMYCHGMATLALGEAYAMTGDVRLQPYFSKAIGYTIRAQHVPGGGWRYQPGDEGDTSQFGWQVMALRSAEVGGHATPRDTRAGMIRFLNSVSTGPNRGLASYRPNSGPTRTMTAEALACRLFLQVDSDQAAVDEAIRFVMEELPTNGPMNLYYWYYATLALFQTGGDSWTTWNTALQQRLLAAQGTSGESAGSWPTATIWGGYGGRVYTTAMGALCLEVYYRHLPVYGRRNEVAER
jgi:hypothetical protein